MKVRQFGVKDPVYAAKAVSGLQQLGKDQDEFFITFHLDLDTSVWFISDPSVQTQFKSGSANKMTEAYPLNSSHQNNMECLSPVQNTS